MRTLCQFLGESLKQRSSEGWERWTMWFGVAVGIMMAGVMAYAWWTAPAV